MVKVLVVCATGKMGRNVSKALADKGFEVYGTTRSEKSFSSMKARGVTPVLCNYIDAKSLDEAFKSTGCKLAFILTDFFAAAKQNKTKELQHGKTMVDVCKANGCEYVVLATAADLEYMNEKAHHIKSKIPVEEYFKQSGLKGSILRPVAFFENFDEPANYNPLKKGSVKFLSEAPVKMCCTYDIGLAAAVHFENQESWNGKTLDVASWCGSVHDVAKALETVSGVKTTGSLAMPLCLRYLFLNDLHNMCLYFENDGGFKSSIEEFKKVVPTAMSAEDFFRFHGKFSDGSNIVATENKV